MKKIKIKTKSVKMEAELNDSKVANQIWERLPITSEVNTWGEEIYFNIPLKMKIENPKETVNCGDLGYRPQGPALCIFFGPTPISKANEIRPASAVEVVGKLLGEPSDFSKVCDGEKITLEKA